MLHRSGLPKDIVPFITGIYVFECNSQPTIGATPGYHISVCVQYGKDITDEVLLTPKIIFTTIDIFQRQRFLEHFNVHSWKEGSIILHQMWHEHPTNLRLKGFAKGADQQTVACWPRQTSATLWVHALCILRKGLSQLLMCCKPVTRSRL